MLAHLGVKSKIFLGPLSDLSALVGFCTSNALQGVKYQLWNLDLGGGGVGGSIHLPWQIPSGKVPSHLGFKSKVLPRTLTDSNVLVGFRCAAGCQITTLIFGFGRGSSINIPWTIIFYSHECLCGILHLRSTVSCQLLTLYSVCGRGGGGGVASRNISCMPRCRFNDVENAFTVIYFLLVASNL